ncbi:TetR/AcrR family transcriptional regulator [Sinirhodobacter populi]|uniref:TetR/AcrR family transcriptional regulator n=2 Tax=Paenirhodobacter populi TaxID=2306993 RepID=A0A443J991_9RHOB|nr:TetR/AcrR family transcriptional regulator [Sinirhodobacter populi]
MIQGSMSMESEEPLPPEVAPPAAEAAGQSRRAPGRPPLREQEETRQIIIEAAAHEFVTAGFAHASMSRIAHAAGVSTRTLYRVATGKDDLFRIVAEQRIARIVADFLRVRGEGLSPAEELVELTTAYAGFVLGPEVSSTTRMVGEQQGRFPDLATSFRQNAQRLANAFDMAVAELFARRFPGRDDAAFIAHLLRLVFLGQQRQQTAGIAPPLTDAEIRIFARQVTGWIARTE